MTSRGSGGGGGGLGRCRTRLRWAGSESNSQVPDTLACWLFQGPTCGNDSDICPVFVLERADGGGSDHRGGVVRAVVGGRVDDGWGCGVGIAGVEVGQQVAVEVGAGRAAARSREWLQDPWRESEGCQ